MPFWVFCTSFEASDLGTRQALMDLRAYLTEKMYSSEFIFRIEIVLAELLNNITEHAYVDRASGQITLRLEQCSDGVLASVTDTGLEMPGLELPQGHMPSPNVALQDLPEGGFGWHIIKSQSDSLSYVREGSKNHTTLRFDTR